MAVQQFTDYIPTFLNVVNAAGLAVGVSTTTGTLAAEPLTGYQISTGVVQGSRFYLTAAQANYVSSAAFPCRSGWYRVVLVDPAAVAANIQYGTIGAMVTVAKGQDVVTDGSSVLTLGCAPVVFLGQVTPGQYTIVQDLGFGGEASLLIALGQTVSVGSVLVSTATGAVAVAGAISDTVLATIVALAEAAVTTPGSLTLSAVAAASGGSAVYTGTITGGAANAFAGFIFVIAGFVGAALVDNGTFLCTASSATTLALNNAAAVAVTAAGTAGGEALVRSRLGAPFGI